ncbi:PIR Superfamily Protein [Plasmodium ovale wallikeri]|uniref:PIR Superfamily Protein n=1 Tax=Plasmodium ovale wallikeri TaxID=864142 RepID=A0A1A9ABE3_PLAOA|nr:PIR Superfamily Protein [Plasmodium ovale wallikeri]
MSDFPYDFSYDKKLILKFCHNLYKINVKVNGLQNHLFNYLSKNDKTYCTSLNNIDAFNENKIIKCKYMDYIGKGLKEYQDTLKRCFEKTEQSNYCKDFNELNEIYKEDYIYWKTSTADYINIFIMEMTFAVISASSAIGATAGISLFLIYLYKFTNIGSFFGHVNQKNNTMFLNMDTEPHNLTQPTSELENSNFERSHYDI